MRKFQNRDYRLNQEEFLRVKNKHNLVKIKVLTTAILVQIMGALPIIAIILTQIVMMLAQEH